MLDLNNKKEVLKAIFGESIQAQNYRVNTAQYDYFLKLFKLVHMATDTQIKKRVQTKQNASISFRRKKKGLLN